jgi:hypothetical protein
MKLIHTVAPFCMLAAAAVGQTPPVPPAAPTPPVPAIAPTPALAPLPPMDFDFEFPGLNEDLLAAQDQLQNMKFDFQFDSQAFKDQIKENAEQWALAAPKIALDGLSKNLAGPFAFAPQVNVNLSRMRHMSDDNAYNSGQRALDQHHYPEALEDFNQVAAHDGPHADGAAYWKAYTLIKLGRKDEALAAIADLRKSHPQSRWLDDAKVLEIDAGKPVTPESESDEELKLIALNGLMQSDPDRALPLLENLLKSNQSPRVKKRAVYVLAASDSPRAQQLLQQVAKGQSNPDVQLAAIQYLGGRRNDPAKAQLLMDIYGTSNDPNIKRAILNALAGDPNRVLQIARSEKNPELRVYAIRMLGGRGDAAAGDALVGMYPEGDQDVKGAILDALTSQRNAKAMVSLARAEKDPKLKQRIVERLAGMRSPEATDYLMEILK